ncbi:MAG: DUF2946 family protein [Burkholderiaceae bacterium]
MWLAMLVIAGQVLLPLFSVSIANASAAGERVAVCTSLGIAWVNIGEPAPHEGDTGGHLHCAFCAAGVPLPASAAPLGLSFRAPAQASLRHDTGQPAVAPAPEGQPPPSRAPPIPA